MVLKIWKERNKMSLISIMRQADDTWNREWKWQRTVIFLSRCNIHPWETEQHEEVLREIGQYFKIKPQGTDNQNSFYTSREDRECDNHWQTQRNKREMWTEVQCSDPTFKHCFNVLFYDFVWPHSVWPPTWWIMVFEFLWIVTQLSWMLYKHLFSLLYKK